MANSSFTGSVAGYASGTQPGLVSTTAQTFAGAKTFNSGVVIGGNTTSDSGLGTISSVTNSSYYEGSFSVTFNSGMNTSSTNVNIKYTKIGKLVSLFIPSAKVTAGASTYYWETGTGAIPANLRVTQTASLNCVAIFDNNTIYTGAYWYIYTDGTLSLRNFRTNNAQTNWVSGTTNCGFFDQFVSYNQL